MKLESVCMYLVRKCGKRYPFSFDHKYINGWMKTKIFDNTLLSLKDLISVIYSTHFHITASFFLFSFTSLTLFFFLFSSISFSVNYGFVNTPCIVVVGEHVQLRAWHWIRDTKLIVSFAQCARFNTGYNVSSWKKLAWTTGCPMRWG